MNTLHICCPTRSDAQSILAFESANRAYFEQWINARDPSYYSLGAVRRAIDEGNADREADRAYPFLVKQGDQLVGRVNFTALARPYFNKATIGYRIGEDWVGHGFASQAVELALREAFGPLKLGRIEALVRSGNVGSARVLERNGFVQFGLARRSMLLDGVYHDLAYFERHAQPL